MRKRGRGWGKSVLCPWKMCSKAARKCLAVIRMKRMEDSESWHFRGQRADPLCKYKNGGVRREFESLRAQGCCLSCYIMTLMIVVGIIVKTTATVRLYKY